MSNDLISREALKEFINKVCFGKEWAKYRADYGSKGQIECILEYIDNAPTVEPHYVLDLPDDVVKTLQTLSIDYSDGIAIFERI